MNTHRAHEAYLALQSFFTEEQRHTINSVGLGYRMVYFYLPELEAFAPIWPDDDWDFFICDPEVGFLTFQNEEESIVHSFSVRSDGTIYNERDIRHEK